MKKLNQATNSIAGTATAHRLLVDLSRGCMSLLRLTTLLLPMCVLAEDKIPSLIFLEFLGMSEELQEIGIDTDSQKTQTDDEKKDPSDTATEINADDKVEDGVSQVFRAMDSLAAQPVARPGDTAQLQELQQLCETGSLS